MEISIWTKIKCAIFTSLVWIAGIAITYSYAVTSQKIIIPNQTGYMEVRHNDLQLTPASFDATPRKEQTLDELVRNVTK